MNINEVLHRHGYAGHPQYGAIAQWIHGVGRSMYASEQDMMDTVHQLYGPGKIGLNEESKPYRIWQHPSHPIDPNAIGQLETALRLPVAVGGAGMPDMHLGYALPIGGVVALDRAVSPAFVGYDISCMMQLSILSTDYTAEDLEDASVRQKFLHWVLASTSFGLGSALEERQEHPVMQHPLWQQVPFLRNLKDLAWKQLGSSGAGNHFADIVVGHSTFGDPWIGLLTHSGSRGTGNKAGNHYALLADKQMRGRYNVPKDYGWLEVTSDLGAEYLAVMDLMGHYAQANHDIIHQRFLSISGTGLLERVSNRHNFAWVQKDGSVLHRKGATPAEYGAIGVIPGSSGSPSYLVRGLGNPESWNSASHGAGRPHSRTVAKKQYDKDIFLEHMAHNRITHFGVAADETVAAYKNIENVIAAQKDLVEPVAIMYPKVVVMGGTQKSDDGD